MPIDFSDVSKNALKYAYHLAVENHAEIYLLNCYDTPARHVNVMIDLADILQKDVEKSLLELKENCYKEFIEHIPIELITYKGLLQSGIAKTVQKHQIDLVIIGTHGASGYLKKIIGTNTSSLLNSTHCPILIVPEKYEFSGWDNAVIATDFTYTAAINKFAKFKKLVNGFPVKLKILHVLTEKSQSENLREKELQFKKDFVGKNIDFVYQHDDNISDGILNYLKESNANLIVVVKHQYSFLTKLLHDSATKQLAFQTTIPVLILQDE